jgi:hypothetical protein
MDGPVNCVSRAAAGVPETIAMKMTCQKTRSVFDRYDITSEEDLAEGVEEASGADWDNCGDKCRHGRGSPERGSS